MIRPNSCSAHYSDKELQLKKDFEACKVDVKLVAPNRRPELFLISSETMEALSLEEVKATYTDMRELGINKLPYPTLDIGVPARTYIHSVDEETDRPDKMFDQWQIRIRYVNEEPVYPVMIIAPSGMVFDLGMLSLMHINVDQVGDIDTLLEKIAIQLRATLIVLLATRNVEKERVKNKSLAMGIGAKKDPMKAVYTTTLRLPVKLERDEGAKVGATVRPHLRRGHIRHQKYGPQLCFEKLIWIEPVFVNCDEDFISSRTAYNTSINLKGISA